MNFLSTEAAILPNGNRKNVRCGNLVCRFRPFIKPLNYPETAALRSGNRFCCRSVDYGPLRESRLVKRWENGVKLREDRTPLKREKFHPG